MPRLLLLALTLITLGACTSDLSEGVFRSRLGEFQLDTLVVIVDEPVKGALSRDASDAELKAAVTQSVQSQLGRFDGGGAFGLGIKVAGYVLAQPGIPVVLAPRSILFLNVNVYDLRDGTARRLNGEVQRFTVFEDAGGDTVLGSGYTQSGEEQLAEMAENAAIEIEKWLRDNPKWFAPRPDLAPAEPAPAAAGES